MAVQAADALEGCHDSSAPRARARDEPVSVSHRHLPGSSGLLKNGLEQQRRRTLLQCVGSRQASTHALYGDSEDPELAILAFQTEQVRDLPVRHPGATAQHEGR